MSDYDVMTKAEQTKVLAAFPRIDAKRLTEEVNDLFRPYLFIRRSRDQIEVWTSCCRKHKTMHRIQRTIEPKDWPIMYGAHNEKSECPYCGAPVTVKNAAKLGKRRNLIEYHPVVFLNEKDGDLYARCYWARKDYAEGLADAPKFMPVYGVHFSIGKTEMIHDDFWDPKKLVRVTVEGNYDPNHRKITEPFWEGGWCGMRYLPYYVYGLEEIPKSNFRYCEYEMFRMETGHDLDSEQHKDLIKYLTAYSIYPKQIEMLMKTCGEPLVADLVVGRRKNKAIINWNKTDPRAAFGLTGAELKAWRESCCSIYRIEQYKLLKRNNHPVSFSALNALEQTFKNGFDLKCFVEWCAKQDVDVEKAVRYIERFTGPCHGGMGYRDEVSIWRLLTDYRTMAEQLGYDLTVERVLWPKNLDLAHNEAMTEINLRKERELAEQDKDLIRQARKSIKQRKKKYNIEAEGYLIRIAESAAEVRIEGRLQEHCVAGYAERHMKGVTTILFLRESSHPSTPLYTIEMNGNNLVQIHGYRNEFMFDDSRRAPDPRKTMAWLLDPWLKWLRDGSKRNKTGAPVGLRIAERKTRKAVVA